MTSSPLPLSRKTPGIVVLVLFCFYAAWYFLLILQKRYQMASLQNLPAIDRIRSAVFPLLDFTFVALLFIFSERYWHPLLPVLYLVLTFAASTEGRRLSLQIAAASSLLFFLPGHAIEIGHAFLYVTSFFVLAYGLGSLHDMEERQKERMKNREALLLAEAERVEGEKFLQEQRLKEWVREEKFNAIRSLCGHLTQVILSPLLRAKDHLAGTKELEEPVKSVSQEIEKACQAASSFSGLGATSLTFSPVDLNAMVREVLVPLERQCLQEGIVIRKKLKEEIPMVHGERESLQQALLRILENARESLQGVGLTATPRGGEGTSPWRGISIETGMHDHGVTLTVSDTGGGISKETLSYIFDPFFTTKEEKRHRGLGLTLAYLTVQNHQGKIEVESVEGKGTTVAVTLPAVREEEDSTSPE